MGINRKAERHYVRRRPPPEREAERWIELADAAGRTFWLDVEIWLRPAPIRTRGEIPAPLGLDAAAFAAVAPAVEEALLAAGCDFVEVAE